MELIVRGLMALALVDCPEAQDVCPNGAAILIPDTSYFEALGLHPHSAVLSIPLAWIGTDHSGGGYEVVDSGSEPMAVFVLAPGDHLVLGKADELEVRPLRGTPVLKRSDASELPLSQLLQAEELVERPEPDAASVRNVIFIRTGRISSRSLFGAELEGADRVEDLSFQASGAHKFQPRPLATEIVVDLPSQGLVLERLSLNSGHRAWPLHAPAGRRSSGPIQNAVLSYVALDPWSAPGPHVVAMLKMTLNRHAVHEALARGLPYVPSDDTLQNNWYFGGSTPALSAPCPGCNPANPIRCPPLRVAVQSTLSEGSSGPAICDMLAGLAFSANSPEWLKFCRDSVGKL